jgi:hypothetical protein
MNQNIRRAFNTVEKGEQFANQRGRRSLFLGEFKRAHERAFGAAIEFVADGPVIAPDEVRRLIRIWVDEEKRALKIVQQGAIGELRHIEEQTAIQLLRLVGVTPGVEQNEGFADFDVAALVGVQLANDHDAAKDEQEQEQKDELVLAHKTHARFLLEHRRG